MTPTPVFLDVDPTLVEKSLLVTEDPAEDEFKKLFPVDTYPSKVVKPHPGFCIKSKEVGTETKIFVNICYTDAIPPPPSNITEEELLELWQSDSDSLPEYRIPMSIGDVHSESDKKGKTAKAVDIAINESFFSKVQNSSIFKQFVLAIVFEALSNKHKLHATDDRIMLKNCKAYGTLQLHRIQQREVQQKMQTPLEELSGMQTVNKPKIETISSVTYNSEENSRKPEYRLFKKNGEDGFLYGEFRMLNVLNAKEVTLDIGEDRIILESKQKGYFLDVFVPVNINQDEIQADFNKNSKILTVKMGLTESFKEPATF